MSYDCQEIVGRTETDDWLAYHAQGCHPQPGNCRKQALTLIDSWASGVMRIFRQVHAVSAQPGGKESS